MDNYQKFSYLFNVSERCLGIILELMGSLIIFLVTIFAVYNVDQLNSSTVTLVVTYALQIIPNLSLLIKSTSNVENNIVAVERIEEFKASKTLQEPDDQVLESDDWPSSGTIEYENFSVRYQEGSEDVLNKISVCFAGGTKTSVIGKSAAGKTTFVLSLFR